MKKTSRKVVVIWIGLVVLIDQLAKWVARGPLLKAGPFSFLGDWIRLETVENSGAFLSLGASWSGEARRWAFQIGVVATLAYITWLYKKKAWDRRATFGLAMIWAGGFGNLIDRFWKDSVTDFLILGQGWLRTGVFNVADFAIVLGLVFVLWGREIRSAPLSH